MKKFIAGLIFGLVISLAAVAYASDTIQAYLFPAKITVNGKEASMGEEYKILNYEGHAYLPIRYVGEYIGGFVDYDEDTNTITLNYYPGGSDVLTSSIAPTFHVGSIQVERKGDQSVISGLMSLDKDTPDHGLGDHHIMDFDLKFYDASGKLLRTVNFLGGFDHRGEIQYFEQTVDGDLSTYSKVELVTGLLDHTRLTNNPW